MPANRPIHRFARARPLETAVAARVLKLETSSRSPLSLDLRPQHPARSDAAHEEAVLRKARAADVRQLDEGHDATPPRRLAATACDRAERVPQNRDDWISPVLLQPRLEGRHCERH